MYMLQSKRLSPHYTVSITKDIRAVHDSRGKESDDKKLQVDNETTDSKVAMEANTRARRSRTAWMESLASSSCGGARTCRHRPAAEKQAAWQATDSVPPDWCFGSRWSLASMTKPVVRNGHVLVFLPANNSENIGV